MNQSDDTQEKRDDDHPVNTEARCPACDAALPSHARFCLECGRPMLARAEGAKKTSRCPHCEAEIAGTRVKCPHCGDVQWAAPLLGIVFAGLCLGVAKQYAPLVPQPWMRHALQWAAGSLGSLLSLVEVAWWIEMAQPSLHALGKRRNLRALIRALRHHDAGIAMGAFRSLERLDAWDELLAIANDESEKAATRLIVAQALAAMHPRPGSGEQG